MIIRIILKSFLFPGLLSILFSSAQATASVMIPFSIDLPNYVLHFTLPEEVAKSVMPNSINLRFSLDDASYRKNGFRELASILHDIKGPFWVGAYGSLKFQVLIQKKLPEYGDSIKNSQDLDRYVRWWIGRGKDSVGCVITSSTLNGVAAVRRSWSTFNDPADREPRHIELFSLPMSSEIFVDIGFNIIGWEGGYGKEAKWKPKVEALREAIKATIVLEPKAK